MIIAVHAGGDTDEKADGVKMPLYLFKLDSTLAEQVAHGYVQYDDRDQGYPDPGDGPGNL